MTTENSDQSADGAWETRASGSARATGGMLWVLGAALAVPLVFGLPSPASAQQPSVGEFWDIRQLIQRGERYRREKREGPVQQIRLAPAPCNFPVRPYLRERTPVCALQRADLLVPHDTMLVDPLWRAELRLEMDGEEGAIVLAPELTKGDQEYFNGLRFVEADPVRGGGDIGSYTLQRDDTSRLPLIQLHRGTLVVWRWDIEPPLRIDVAAAETRNVRTDWAIGVDSVNVQVDLARARAERAFGRDSIEAHAWLFVREGMVEIVHPAADEPTRAERDELWRWTESTPPWLHDEDEVGSPPSLDDLVKDLREALEYEGGEIWRPPSQWWPFVPPVVGFGLCLAQILICEDDVQGTVVVNP